MNKLILLLLAIPTAALAKHHVLKATPENVQWGWLDPAEKPRLTIESGDEVSIETLMHAKDQITTGVSMEKIVELRKANPGGGPHSLTGPIAVNGAEPGDVLEIRILKIVPKKVGTNFNLPGKEFPTIGALAKDFPEGHVQYFDIDPKAKT
ncbi:MAG: acetamidase/formamidase family protein, partial [Myxococcales bacterium]